VSVVVTGSESRQTIALRSVDVARGDFVSESNLLLRIPAAIAVGVVIRFSATNL